MKKPPSAPLNGYVRLNKLYLLTAILVFTFISKFSLAQSDVCGTPTSIVSRTTCIAGISSLTLQTIQSKTQSSPNVTTGTCLGTAGVDVWYSFTAQSTNPTIALSSIGASLSASTGGGTHLQVLSGTCPSGFTSVACTNGAGATLNLNPTLIIGTVYFIRVYITPTTATGGTTAAWGYTICVTDPAPVNDDCSGAITLTPGTTCSNTVGNMIGATLSTAPAPTCGTPVYDVWYSFTANETDPIITVSGNTNFANPQIQVLSGLTCGTLADVSCTSNGVFATSGLTTGAIYFVRVYSTSAAPTTNGTFNICIVDPPANDVCATATTRNPVASCGATAGQTLFQATEAGSPTSTCGANTYDVWYKFTVPAGFSTFKIAVSGAGSSLTSANTFIEAYNASSCGGISSGATLGCSDIGTGLTLSNLNAGAVYYFRVFTTTSPTTGTNANWAFSICVSELVPSNDNCASSILLSNDVTNGAGTVWAATASAGIPVGCATGNPDDDVWYKFVAAQTTASITILSAGGGLTTSGAMIQAFSGTCGALTSIGCGSMVAYLSGLTPGNTYFIRVYSSGTGALSNAANSAFSIIVGSSAPAAGRMNEVFKETILSGPNILNTAWEVTYGPDGFLWITEAKGYKAYRMDPNTGAKTTILDISQGASGYLTGTEHTNFNVQFTTSQSPWPQGGFAGLVLHPKFLDPVTPKNYVYISYVHKFDSASVLTNGGYFFKNSIVRFTYNTGTGKLESPVALCDTLPGSSDHNSQRMIIVPVGGTNYLFYGSGDMGAGQLASSMRVNHAQDLSYYQGKILRFNLEDDGDIANPLDKWIPNDNPYNGAKQSAIWCLGIRNNQGFAYDTTLGILYGSSHGPYSDDELNIIQPSKNYGHPVVIGYAADGNYNASNAGAPNQPSSLAVITDEVAAAAAIPNYKDPLFSGYAPNQATLHNIWMTNPGNNTWPSEAWSGLDIYKNTLIPGWKNSLVVCGLKWGRVLRLKLGPLGTTIVPTNGGDTVALFGGVNRYRDLAFAPNGKDIFVSMESATNTGPNVTNPTVPACTNCVVKFTFLGYKDAGGKSTIPDAIDVTDGTVNTVDSATQVTIDPSNNNLWVPITGPDGNILAEINANGNNLGVVKSAFYKNSGPLRVKNGIKYLDRNMTITPTTQPGSAVSIRLYLSKAEFDALDADPTGGVSAITDLKILKNSDQCSAAINLNTTVIPSVFSEAHGTNGYMLQGSVTSFSSFYFASSNIALPLNLLTFRGSLQNSATLLEWETTNEVNTAQFIIERSLDGQIFQEIGTTPAKGNYSNKNYYSYTDNDALHQPSLVLYYRIRMVDKDGKFSYSDVVTITLPVITGKVSVFPNPASKEIKVTISAPGDGKIQWNLTDNTGRMVIQNSAELKKGNNIISIKIDNLSTGFYYLGVSGAGIDQKVKLEKL